MGVDLGKLSDFTAISILEEVKVRRAHPELGDLLVGHEGRVEFQSVYHLRYLARPSLRTPYLEIISRLSDMVKTPELADEIEIVVDKTGVGNAVYELMTFAKLPSLVPVTITGGTSPQVDTQDGGFHVPKKDIASSLQALFGTGRLKVAKGMDLVPDFLKEIENFKVKMTPAGNATYEAWREGDHDDIVLSVGLAAWWALFSRPQFQSRNRIEKEEDTMTPKQYLDAVRTSGR